MATTRPLQNNVTSASQLPSYLISEGQCATGSNREGKQILWPLRGKVCVLKSEPNRLDEEQQNRSNKQTSGLEEHSSVWVSL
jgi:hypothetical protein